MRRASLAAASSLSFAACELVPEGVPYPDVRVPVDPAAIIATIHRTLAARRAVSTSLRDSLRLDRCRLLVDEAAEALGLAPSAGVTR